MANTILKLENINKIFNYNNKQIDVLNNINCSIKQGEFIAMIGESGSGKTTLLQIAGLLDAPTNGHIYIDNKLCSNLSQKKLTMMRKQYCNFVFQDHKLMSEFSAIENVMIPLLINKEKKAVAYNAALTLIQKLNLQHRIDVNINTLSGGEKQRISLARALINKPKLLLADEPTGNLDPKTSDIVFKLLLDITREYNTSVLFVTHNHKLAQQADRIFMLSKSSLKEIYTI